MAQRAFPNWFKPWQYANHTYDDVLGMYHAQYGFLDSENRGFTQVDPVKDGLNWYIYCSNNPINRAERNRFIFINAGLPERRQRIVCAHELGHDILHRALAADNALKEFMIYDMTSRPEYEANVFAAHLLLDEKEIMRRAHGGYDAYQIASSMNTDINLMLIKMNEMNRQGYKFNLPYVPHGDFLADD